MIQQLLHLPLSQLHSLLLQLHIQCRQLHLHLILGLAAQHRESLTAYSTHTAHTKNTKHRQRAHNTHKEGSQHTLHTQSTSKERSQYTKQTQYTQNAQTHMQRGLTKHTTDTTYTQTHTSTCTCIKSSQNTHIQQLNIHSQTGFRHTDTLKCQTCDTTCLNHSLKELEKNPQASARSIINASQERTVYKHLNRALARFHFH